MASVKKNLVWNILLTLSGYLFPVITFPYVTRVLGAENLGLANFALSIVDYAILFSTLGLTTIGYRYIPQCNDDKEKRNNVFNHLVSLHIVMSGVILILYLTCVYLTPQLYEHKELYIVGISKIVMNVFLVEWLFQGMQDFKYITIRTLIIRGLYTIAVFILVKSVDDYDVYFYITMVQVVINAIINWRYSGKYVSFSFSLERYRDYLFPVLSMGINRLLLSFYSTVNILVLGFMCSNLAVGYFTTATKLYSIILSFLNAYNGVFVPHLNSLYGKGQMDEFKRVINYSISIVGILSLPLITGGVFLAPEIIRLIAGEGYEPAILPFQIVLIQVLLVGLAQIFENQILLSFKKFKEVLICTSVSTCLSVIILFLFVPRYAEVASAYAVAIPHVLELILLYYYAHKTIEFTFPFREYMVNAVICIPMALGFIMARHLFSNYLLILLLSVCFAIVYLFFMECYIIKNTFAISLFNKFPIQYKIKG